MAELSADRCVDEHTFFIPMGVIRLHLLCSAYTFDMHLFCFSQFSTMLTLGYWTTLFLN